MRTRTNSTPSRLLAGMVRLCLIPLLVGLPNTMTAQVSDETIARIEAALPSEGAPSSKPRHLLLFTRMEGYRHASVPTAVEALSRLGRKTGAFTTEVSDTMIAFEAGNLARFDAVCFISTTRLAFESPAYRRNLLEFVRDGGGLAGIHAASDNFYSWIEGSELIGGVFDGHPWTADGTWRAIPEDPGHPILSSFDRAGFDVTDEIYRIKQHKLRDNARVLLRLDPDAPENLAANGARFTDRDIPIAWVRRFGSGRLFYSSLGHNDAIYWNPAILKHYLAGLQFALGDIDVDTTPKPHVLRSHFVQTALDSLTPQIVAYEYGQSRTALMHATALIRMARHHAPHRALIEERLLESLQEPHVTLAGKQYICEQLATFATDKSVPALGKLLLQQETAEMSLFALERMSSSASTRALRDALERSPNEYIPGIMRALASRGDTKSVNAIAKFLKNDAGHQHAAVKALGVLGTDEARRHLASALPEAAGQYRTEIVMALMDCARQAREAGNSKRAFEIYESLWRPEMSVPVRGTALRGMALARPEDAPALLVSVLRGDDRELHEHAIQTVARLPESVSLTPLFNVFDALSTSAQAQFVEALRFRNSASERNFLLQLAAETQGTTQRAALASLADVGGVESVDVLLRAAESDDQATREQAGMSLSQLAGKEVDAAILAKIPAATETARLSLLRAVENRRIESGRTLLLQLAGEGDRKTRVAALSALRVLGDADAFPRLLEFVETAKSAAVRRAAGRAVLSVARRISDSTDPVKPLLASIARAGSAESRAALMAVAGELGSAEALPTLRKALASDEQADRRSAIRALSLWPDGAPIPDLLPLAKENASATERVLALRGYVQLIQKDTTLAGERLIEAFKTAFSLCKDATQQKMVLSGLAKTGRFELFALAKDYLDSPELGSEAEAAVVTLAKNADQQHARAAREQLARIAANSSNAALAQEASELAEELEKTEDHILYWFAAGPFTQDDTDLFEYAFAPESKSDSIEWTRLDAGANKWRPWLVDLRREYGGRDRVVYLKTSIYSSADQDARLELGSDDGVKVWLNSELVHANMAFRGATPGDDVVDVQLKQGENVLLLKVVQASGGWGACARFRTREGEALDGLTYTTTTAPATE